MSRETRIAVPGEHLGVIEEYIAGEGTFEEDGNILASVPGHVVVNEDAKVISVKTLNPPVVLHKGDHVFAEVVGLYESMVLTEIIMVDGNEREIVGETSATIHISKIDRRYTGDVGEEFRLGDLVRAEVIQVKPSVQLTTSYPHLGVIKASCRQCRAPLSRKGNVLHCINCERNEKRKLADDFGDVRLRGSRR